MRNPWPVDDLDTGEGFLCPECGKRTSVIDSRPHKNGGWIRRRRSCADCGFRFTTLELRRGDAVSKAELVNVIDHLNAVIAGVERLIARESRQELVATEETNDDHG